MLATPCSTRSNKAAEALRKSGGDAADDGAASPGLRLTKRGIFGVVEELLLLLLLLLGLLLVATLGWMFPHTCGFPDEEEEEEEKEEDKEEKVFRRRWHSTATPQEQTTRGGAPRRCCIATSATAQRTLRSIMDDNEWFLFSTVEGVGLWCRGCGRRDDEERSKGKSREHDHHDGVLYRKGA